MKRESPFPGILPFVFYRLDSSRRPHAIWGAAAGLGVITFSLLHERFELSSALAAVLALVVIVATLGVWYVLGKKYGYLRVDAEVEIHPTRHESLDMNVLQHLFYSPGSRSTATFIFGVLIYGLLNERFRSIPVFLGIVAILIALAFWFILEKKFGKPRP